MPVDIWLDGTRKNYDFQEFDPDVIQGSVKSFV
jgi:hypothetical protein